MIPSADPLTRLVVDEAEVNRELLASTLEGKIRVDIVRGTFVFVQRVREQLSKRQQVIVALLAHKALHLLDPKFPEALRPVDIESASGIRGGTLRPILKVLVDSDLIKRQDPERAYFVPGHSIESAKKFLNTRGE